MWLNQTKMCDYHGLCTSQWPLCIISEPLSKFQWQNSESMWRGWNFSHINLCQQWIATSVGAIVSWLNAGLSILVRTFLRHFVFSIQLEVNWFETQRKPRVYRWYTPGTLKDHGDQFKEELELVPGSSCIPFFLSNGPYHICLGQDGT